MAIQTCYNFSPACSVSAKHPSEATLQGELCNAIPKAQRASTFYNSRDTEAAISRG